MKNERAKKKKYRMIYSVGLEVLKVKKERFQVNEKSLGMEVLHFDLYIIAIKRKAFSLDFSEALCTRCNKPNSLWLT